MQVIARKPLPAEECDLAPLIVASEIEDARSMQLRHCTRHSFEPHPKIVRSPERPSRRWGQNSRLKKRICAERLNAASTQRDADFTMESALDLDDIPLNWESPLPI